MTINYYLDSKFNKNGEKAIYCFIRGIAKYNKIQINTGIKINPKFWNEKNQSVRKTFNGHIEINLFLNYGKSEIQKVYSQAAVNKLYSYERLKNDFCSIFNRKPKKEKPKTFFDVFDCYLESKKDTASISTKNNYQTLLNHLLNFQHKNRSKITFDTINLEFFDKLMSYYINDLQNINNTFHNAVKLLKSFLNWATERGYNNLLEYKKFKTKGTENEVVYLTEDELLRLFNLDLTSNPRLEKVRDVFCLACFSGQRFSDVSKLKAEHIRDGKWYLRTQKTKDLIEIPLNDYALEIVQKYFDNGLQFPVITNKCSNRYLKELGQIAEIVEPITIVRYKGAERLEHSKPKYELLGTHTARRTFVTLSLEKGLRQEILMSVTGHKDYRTLKKYIKITDNVKEQEMKKVWRKK